MHTFVGTDKIIFVIVFSSCRLYAYMMLHPTYDMWYGFSDKNHRSSSCRLNAWHNSVWIILMVDWKIYA